MLYRLRQALHEREQLAQQSSTVHISQVGSKVLQEASPNISSRIQLGMGSNPLGLVAAAIISYLGIGYLILRLFSNLVSALWVP